MSHLVHHPLREERRRVNPLHLIHKWSIEHPYVIIAFYTGVALLSVITIGFYMPRRMMPYVESPMVGVVTMMPGLSAEEMELYISKPIEESLVNVKNLHYIRSTSQDGFSIVTLEFYYGQDMKKALFDVQALMNVIQANLPATGANLKPSWVLAIDPLNLPILSLSLTGEGWDPVKLREFADNEVVNRLKVLPNVYSVVPFGGYRRQLQVVVDRDKLAAYGLSILDVKNAIDRYNVSRPGGTLTSGPNEAIIRVDTRAVDAETVANYPLASITGGRISPPSEGGAGGGSGGGMGGMGGLSTDSGNGLNGWNPRNPLPQSADSDHPRIIYIRDVARVLDTHWERRSSYHYVKHEPGTEGEIIPAIEVSIIQNPEASSAKVVPAAMKVIRQLEQEYPGIQFEVAYDNAHFVNILFENMLHELGMAVLLCGIAVFFFLGEWRGTLISMLTIPMSLAMAILCLVPMGFTLNSGTLVGLLLSIGRLVDDSIIDIHAVERHLRMGKDPKNATIDGIAEVRLAVIASTLMLVMALSPLLFCGGITQLMFVELVWPIIFGLLASMLVSFTLTALLCAHLLRPEEEREADLRFRPYRYFYHYALGPFQRLLDRLEAGYTRSIAWMLRNRFYSFARKMLIIILGFGFYHFIGSEMMPLADVGQAYGVLEMQPGASFEQTERAVTQFERILLKYPEIEKVSTEIGQETMFESFSPFYTGYAMPSVQAATMMLTLSDKEERKRTIWEVIDGVQQEALATIPGIRRLQIKEMGSDVMASSLAPVSVIVYGKDLELLDQLGQQVAKIAEECDIRQVATSWTMSKPSWEIRIDPRRAQEVGLTPEDISQQAYYALRGGLTNEFYRLPNLRQNTILVRYAPEDRQSSTDLENLYLTTSDGRQVPLKTVATVQLRRAPTLIEHDGLRRVISVNGYYRLDTKPSMDLTMDLMMKSFERLNFPPGYGLEARGDMTQMMDSFRRLLNGLVLAVIFMFLVLVAQFRGFLQPLQMIFSLPLELAGVFFALWLHHQAFSSVSIMAVIVLTGMDITTAILLIDMIMRYRDRGLPRDEAVIAACPQRLRPILMTSVITIIVMLPVSLFPKTGLDAYSPLGTTVVGGLVIGTILSLLDIPIIHTYIDDVIKWLNWVFLRRRWEWPVTVTEEEE
jgi:HAE1 family hydrophobic/amphiphilic exporter-1